MQDDERCCGTGTCLIDESGRCWCGQQWDGKTMCAPGANFVPTTTPNAKPPSAAESGDA
jgi:hypothetical protein